MTREQIVARILNEKLIAILRGLSLGDALPMTQAMLDCGVRVMELPLNQAKPGSFGATAQGIADIRARFGGQIVVGAGTVLNREQVHLVAKAGADFVVSPDTNVDVIGYTRQLGMVSIPGALTPTEAVAAHGAGADFVKLFPAGDMGPGYVKSLCAPLNHIRFLAVGGIHEENAGAFLNAGACGLGVGGKLAHREWVSARLYDRCAVCAQTLVDVIAKWKEEATP